MLKQITALTPKQMQPAFFLANHVEEEYREEFKRQFNEWSQDEIGFRMAFYDVDIMQKIYYQVRDDMKVSA